MKKEKLEIVKGKKLTIEQKLIKDIQSLGVTNRFIAKSIMVSEAHLCSVLKEKRKMSPKMYKFLTEFYDKNVFSSAC